jgi:hypothetical protein
MKLKKNYKILLSTILIILGWLSLGIGYITKVNLLQYLFYFGFIFITFGIILFTREVNSRN